MFRGEKTGHPHFQTTEMKILLPFHVCLYVYSSPQCDNYNGNMAQATAKCNTDVDDDKAKGPMSRKRYNFRPTTGVIRVVAITNVRCPKLGQTGRVLLFSAANMRCREEAHA